MNFLNQVSEAARRVKNPYLETRNGDKRFKSDFLAEVSAVGGYSGREIDELLQNVDDAGSDICIISMNSADSTISIANGGASSVPFSVDGLESIFLANNSPKAMSRIPYIGAKGLGFRSILNWGEEITIRSNGVEIKMSEHIASRFWDSIKPDNAADYEALAREHGRRVPLPVLAVPEISPLVDDLSNDMTTEIIIKFRPDKKDDIMKSLVEFNGYPLLFLRNLKQVIVRIDGREINKAGLSVIDSHSCRLNGRKWFRVLDSGSIDSTHYEVGAARPADSGTDFPDRLFCFFPTRVNSGVNCIVNATLHLDSTRNYLQPGNKVTNDRVLQKAAEAVASLAGIFLNDSSRKVDWLPYEIMGRPFSTHYQPNNDLYSFHNTLRALSAGISLIPTLGSGYQSPDKAIGVSNTIYQIASKVDIPQTADLCDNQYLLPDLRSLDVGTINALAMAIKDNEPALISLINQLLIQNFKCDARLLIDNNHQIIGESFHKCINTGQSIEMPSCLPYRYVSDTLKNGLFKVQHITGKSPDKERELARRLSDIESNVIATEIHEISGKLIPTASDSLDSSQRIELLKALFSLFTNRRDNDFSLPKAKTAALMNENGEWVPARGLVFYDSRFPSGFSKFYNKGFLPDQQVRYPDYLVSDDTDPHEIELFFSLLGVNRFTIKNTVSINDCQEYFNAVTDSPTDREALARCDNFGITAGDRYFWSQFSLDESLDIISRDEELKSLITSTPVLNAFKNRQYIVTAPLSFTAYRLQNTKPFSQLRNYCMFNHSWLLADNCPDITNSQGCHDLLYRLGARRYLTDFRPGDLYSLLNQVALKDSVPANISSFYSEIKNALNAMGQAGNISDGTVLRLWCRTGDSTSVRNADEIYYFDNPTLPRELSDRLPILKLGRREGEDIAKRVFGVKNSSDIQLTTVATSKNNLLSDELAKDIDDLIPGLMLALGTGVNENTLRDRLSRLRNLRIDIVFKADFKFGGSDLSLSLSENSVIPSSASSYIIRSCHPTLAEAKADRGFVDAVVDAICLHLKLSGRDSRNSISVWFSDNNRRRSIAAEFEQHEIDTINRLYGISQQEIEFWNEVADAEGIPFSEANYKKEGDTYLARLFPDYVDYLSIKAFHDRHYTKFNRLHLKALEHYSAVIHVHSAGKINLEETYCSKVNSFRLLDITSLSDNIRCFNPDYKAILQNFYSGSNVCRDFGNIDFDSTLQAPAALYSVKYKIDRFSLPADLQSLDFFPGHDDRFIAWLQSSKSGHITGSPTHPDNNSNNNGSTAESDQSGSSGSDASPILFINADSVSSLQPKSSSGGSSHATGHCPEPSEQRRQELGLEAELKVKEAIEASDALTLGTLWSTNLNDTPTADNDIGYDLTYFDSDNNERLLEVKYFNGWRIIMSDNEYRTAIRNAPRYDIALWDGRKVRILRAPFVDGLAIHPHKLSINLSFE